MSIKTKLLIFVLTLLLLLPSCTPASNVTTAKVIQVIDGDTIIIQGGKHVRYIGIDTPEIYPEVEPFGVEAWQANRALVEGKEVRLEEDVSDRDKYGRLLRYVYVSGIFVNAELIRQGLAYVYPKSCFPDTKYYGRLKEAEREAREERRGLYK
jgi:micrococcal nuclease